MKKIIKLVILIICLCVNIVVCAEPLSISQVSVEGIKPGMLWPEIAQRTDLDGGIRNGAYEWDLYNVHRIQYVGFDLGIGSRMSVRRGFYGLNDDVVRFIDVVSNEVALPCGATVGWSRGGVINCLGNPHFSNSKEFGYDVLVDEIRYRIGKLHFYINPNNYVDKIVITDGYYDM